MIEVKVLAADVTKVPSGQALRVTLGIPRYQPVRHEGNNIVAMKDIYVGDGQGGAQALSLTEAQGERPVFEQVTSIFSTIQPLEMEVFLQANDTCHFVMTGLNGQHVSSSGATYVNAKGYFLVNGFQCARAMKNLKQAPQAKTATVTPKTVTLKTAEAKPQDSNEGLDF